MTARFDPQKALRVTAQHLVGMLSPWERAAFLTALREVAEEAAPEDAAYLALRKIGKTERQARWMIISARSR